MTTDEKFDLLLSKLDKVDNRLDEMDTRLNAVDTRLNAVDTRLNAMDKRLDKIESKLDTLEHSSYLLENDIAPKVQVLLEHHTDLAKNVLVAKGIEERVGMLEFEVKAIKAVMSKSA